MSRQLFSLTLAATTAAAAVITIAGCSNGQAAGRAGDPPRSSAQAAPNGAAAQAATADTIAEAADRGRIMGKDTAPLWMVEVSDFQCPFCKAWHDSTYRAIEKEYVETGKIRLAFINFPLHSNSVPAAVTAMCASAQGKFWGTHDRIFDTQDAWKGQKDPRPFLDSLAVAAGADPARLKACEDGKHVQPLIEADQARFSRTGVSGTPTFFVGSAGLVGALPIKQFRHVIDSVLAAAGKGQ